MTQRIDLAKVATGAYRAMVGLERYLHECGLETSLLDLVRMRASQINGCAFCLDMHSKDARAAGETEQSFTFSTPGVKRPSTANASARLGSGENTYSLKLKLGTLFLTVIVTFFTGLPLFETFSPIGIFNRALVFGGGSALLLIAVILLLEIAVGRRLWCRSLCPAGGLYSLAGRFSPVRVKHVWSRCSACGRCMKSCPVEEVLVPPLMIGAPTVSSGECTRCGRCIDTCRDGALDMGIGYK